ncbi:MAG: hypothetical protein COA94_08725 [Rickettsiales bacterium]|nr:MAG: hypothetical protein COA94_08725 [Rickettsiales bacterium]
MPNEFKEMFGDSALVEWTSYGDCGPDVPLLVAEAGSDVAFGYKCGTGLTNPVLLSDCTIKVSNGSGKFAIKYLADFAGWVGMIITAKCKGCDGVSTSRFFTLDGLPHTKHNRDFLCCKDSPYGTELDLPIVVS